MGDKLRGGTTIGGNIAYHAGNMGSGSNLDADKLDGQEGSYYATADSVAALAALDPVITLNGDVSGSGTMTNLGSTTITTVVANDSHTHTNATVTGTQTATASTIVERDSSADINARLFRSNYADAATISGGIAFRINNSTDNYIRTCNSPSAVRTWLDTNNASNLSSGTVPDARISGSYTGMTNLTGSGTVDFSKFYGNSADTVTAPSFSWTTDPNTGIYTPAADQLAIATGGVQRALFSSSGITGTLVGNASTATKLATARTINGVSFDGSANITIADSTKVALTGNQTVDGIKTFSASPVVPTPTTDTQAVNKAYVDGKYSGFKNYIINGNFDVWQRGVSQASDGYGSDDRWDNSNNISTKTHSQIDCTNTERALFNASKFSRTVTTYIAGTNSLVMKTQAIENITRLAGKEVTISFWAKADGNKKMNIKMVDFYGYGGTPTINGTYTTNLGSIDLTSTWTKYKLTTTLPSLVGKTLGTNGVHTSFFRLDFGFTFSPDRFEVVSYGMTAGQSGTFDIAQVQLEEGSVATPFENRPIGLELSLCQRYYERLDCIYMGYGLATTNVGIINEYKVEKRVLPTVKLIQDSVRISNVNVGLLNYNSNRESLLVFRNIPSTGMAQFHERYDISAEF